MNCIGESIDCRANNGTNTIYFVHTYKHSDRDSLPRSLIHLHSLSICTYLSFLSSCVSIDDDASSFYALIYLLHVSIYILLQSKSID